MIPLQGVPYIRKAGELLRSHQDISLRIIGDGPWVPYQELPTLISSADVCLGIFGDTDKTLRVIPNKVYEAIAMAKPVITADTPAIRELFTDRDNILLCHRADPEDLAKKILELKDNESLRTHIARAGHELFLSRCTPRVIVGQLLQDLSTLHPSRRRNEEHLDL